MLQHVTDPQTCIQCSACEMACPLKAIEAIAGRYCIDAKVCRDCQKCIEECPTGSAASYIEASVFFSVDEQSSWIELPQQRAI